MVKRLKDGTILRGRYRLNNIVGQGGMGNVYQAEDLRLPGRLCAIKEVQPELDATQEMREQEQAQFLREASLLARLDHPNLPKVSDFFTEYRVLATCSTAPTTGELNVWVLKAGGK